MSEEEGGTIQIGPTDQGMVRLIIGVGGRNFELDFEAEEAEDIAADLTSAANIARAAARKQR
ncbi:MAG: DUF6324 family protein [Neomegalonema sp.]|nr:DUF6324 family protein [Neomegalonema sp.]